MEERIEKDHYYLQNVIGISAVEFLWGLGLPIVIESTFLQLFLKSLGASSFAIGLIPFFFFIGSSVFALFSSYLTSGLAFKRKAVIILHLVSGASLLLFGISLFVFGQVSHILFVFFSCYAIFSVCVGMTLPVWLNFLVKIFSENKSVSGLAFMMIAQNVAKLLCSLLIVRFVEKYAFSSESSALAFMAVGVLFILGSTFFLITREFPHPHETPAAKRTPFFAYIIESIRHILKNRNYLYFLAGDLEFFIVVTIISFYANYATTWCGIDAASAAGIFVGCIYCGAIFSNISLGSMGYFSLKNKYIISKIFSFSAVIILTFFCYYWSFYIASFLLGASRGTRMIVFAPAVKKLSGLADSTSYFAVGPILTLPFAICLPLVFGKFLDHFAWLQADGYRIIFIISIVLIFVTLICIMKTNFADEKVRNTGVASRSSVA
jgi:MFS family permease